MTRAPSQCPDCGGALTLDAAAETDDTVFVVNRGGMPYVETRRRPARVVFCNACEYAQEEVGTHARIC